MPDSMSTGSLLSERLQNGPLPAGELLGCATALAAEVRKLHEAGKTVGDLPPGRISLSRGRTGIMELAAGPPGPYSSPERWLGKDADARSDIFSFGALLVEMATGRPAFAGASEEELRRAIVEPAALPTLPPDLARIASNCLARAPEHRYQRMQKVLMELKMLGAAQPPAALAASRDRMENRLRAELAGLAKSVTERLEGIEARLNGLEGEAAALRSQMESNSLVDGQLEERLAAQGAAVSALDRATSQTDDLMERLLEAFDSLQATLLERPESRPPAAGPGGSLESQGA